MKAKVTTTKNPASKSSFKSTCIRRLLSVASALAIVAGGSPVLAANILINPDLDLTSISSQNGPTPNNWVIEATKAISGAFFDGASSEPWCNVQAPDGFGLFFKPFQGNAGENDELTVHLYQDNPASAGGKFILSGYAAGEASYSGLFTTNDPAPATLFVVQFLDSTGTVLSSNAFDLVAAGLPSSGPGSMALFTTEEFTAPANTATVRAGASIVNTYNTTGAQSFFVDAFSLEAVAPVGAPLITNQPVHTSVSPGGTATFTVGVSNSTGATFQWQLNSTNLTNGGNISGADTATLTIQNVSTNDVGSYRVNVSNTAGSAASVEAKLAVVSINFFPVVLISGKVGDTYRIDYASFFAPTDWSPLSTNMLTSSPQLVVDTTSAGVSNRFYRAILNQ